MAIENERLRLVPHRLIATKEAIFIEKSDGEKIPLPKKFEPQFRAVSGGATIERLGLEARRSGERGRFAKLAQFFTFLGESGLLADRKAQQMAEALRPDFRWRQSIAFEEFAVLKLVSLPSGSPLVPWLFGIVAMALGLGVFVLMLVGLNLGFSTAEVTTVSAAPMLAFILTFAIARSARSLIEWMLLTFAGGAASSLKIRLDLVSVSLASDDISHARANLGLLLGGLGCLILTALPGALVPVLPEQLRLFVSYFTLVVLLADLSPLVRSPLTEWLRALYNFLDRKKQGGFEDLMKYAHIALNVIWVAGLALFLALPTVDLVRFFRTRVEFPDRMSMLLTYVLAFPLLVIAVSFVDDLINAVSYGGGAGDRRRVRKLWKRSAPSLPVDEAIQRGQAPARADLERLPLLRQLDAQMRAELLAHARVTDVGEGVAVCREGDKSRSLFIVLSGKMAVAKTGGASRRRVIAFLEPGAVFGEAAFFLGTARTADVVALEPSRVLEIRHNPQMKNLDPQRSSELQLRIWFLQALVGGSFLKNLPSEALDAVVFAGQRANFSAGQRVMREGEVGDACYFLIQGQSSVSQKGQLINKMKAGDAFGEIALLYPGSPRTATVTADSDLICIRLDSESFWRLLAGHLPLAVEIERLAEARLSMDRVRAK